MPLKTMPAKSVFFRNGMPVGLRLVACCVAFSVPLASVWHLNASQRDAKRKKSGVISGGLMWVMRVAVVRLCMPVTCEGVKIRWYFEPRDFNFKTIGNLNMFCKYY